MASAPSGSPGAAKRPSGVVGVALRDTGGDLVEIGEGAGGEDVLRRAIEIEHVAHLHHAPLAQQRHAVAHAHGLLGVVGDDDAGRARLVQDGERLLAHFLAQARIEPGERLVHQEHARPWRNGAGERHALLLAAGEDMRVFARVMGKADAVECGERLGAGLAPRQRAQAEGDVVADGEMGEEREVLEHEADAPLLRRHEAVRPRDLLAVDEHAPGGGALDARGDPEQRGLAAAGRPEQAEDLARRNVEADMIQREACRRSGATHPRR